MNFSKRLFKKAINAIGLDLRRLEPASNPAYQLLKTLKRFGIDLVFDVGANVGQFATALRSVGYRGFVVSFEPLSSAHAVLSHVCRGDSNWHVHRRCAIGNYDGEIEINISGNSISSSVLPMMKAHISASKNSVYVGRERVPISRFDSVAPSYLSNGSRYLLKIDTQGFEWQVLDGALQLLPEISGIVCELSLIQLYEGERLWIDMIHRLEAEGFTLWSILKGLTDQHDGRTLQVDATFVRV